MKSGEALNARPRQSPAILRVQQHKNLPGYWPGIRQPVLVAEVALLSDQVPASCLADFDRAVGDELGDLTGVRLSGKLSGHPVLSRVARAAIGVLQHAGMPTMSAVEIQQRTDREAQVFELVLPALQQAFPGVMVALQAAVGVMNRAGAQSDAVADGVSADHPFAMAVEKIRPLAPGGMNSLRFLQAAHEAGIPWNRVVGNVFQFGWGARARWLDSSFTDRTPNISARMVRDKQATAAVLRRFGLPVPEHGLVRNEQDALQLAQRLGYPVVVKPSNLDGGRGVHAGLKTPDAVRKAYAAVTALKCPILVEKHFEGNDYRVQVFQGEVYWVAHRRPAGVTGDGRQTVQALVEQVNTNPLRGEPGTHALLKRIVLDEEARDWLADQGLGLASVPATGRFVRLRGAANIASGGTVEPVLERAHPDNLALAIRAARMLRLDMAGVDLLIPDISRSWRESGAAICEVNAQPQLSPHLPAYLLQRLVEGEGRIPVVLAMGDVEATQWLPALRGRLKRAGCCLGLSLPQGVWVDGEQVGDATMGAYRGGLVLLGDPMVEAVLVAIGDDALARTGLPVDRADALVLAGPLLDGEGQPDWARSLDMARLLARVSRTVLVDAACAEWVAAGSRLGVQSVMLETTEALEARLGDLMAGRDA